MQLVNERFDRMLVWLVKMCERMPGSDVRHFAEVLCQQGFGR